MQRYCLPSTDPNIETKINKATDVFGSAGKRMNLQRTYKHNRHNTYPLQFTRPVTLGDRAFQVAAARAWNSLPAQIRAASSLLSFRRQTKAHLFQLSYN